MEPQMIDHYNELPHSVNVIDKMNEELEKEQEKNKKLMMLLLHNKILERPSAQPIIINKEQLDEYHMLEIKISKRLTENLNSYKKEGVSAEWEYDLSEAIAFNNSKTLSEILFTELNTYPNLNVSREWCEFHIKSTLQKFKSLCMMQNYWWENMLTDGMCDRIIDMIVTEIFNCHPNQIGIQDLLMIKCTECKELKSSYGGSCWDHPFEESWVCRECWIHSGSDSD